MLREEFVKKILSHQASKSELCRQYGISRPTGDKWIERYLNGEGLDDRCKVPFKTPNKTLPETEAFIVGYRRKHPAIGAVKLHRMLANEGHNEYPKSQYNKCHPQTQRLHFQGGKRGRHTVQKLCQAPSKLYVAGRFQGKFRA